MTEGGAVRPCWNGPTIGRVGDSWADLERRGEALTAGAAERGGASDACPLGRPAADPPGEGAPERYEVAAQLAWLVREVEEPA